MTDTLASSWLTRCATSAFLVLIALVAPTYADAKTIGGFIGSASYSTAADGTGGRFTQARDVAVYYGTDDNLATDKIFVVEGQATSSARVQRLDINGNFERMWGKNVDPSSASTGYEICVAPTACQSPFGAAAGPLRRGVR
jgi:hypothetical protein